MENTFEMSTGADLWIIATLAWDMYTMSKDFDLYLFYFLTCVRYLKRIKKNVGEQVSSLFNIWVFIPLWSMLLSVSSLL